MIKTKTTKSSKNKNRVVALKPQMPNSASTSRSSAKKRFAKLKQKDKMLSCRYELKYRIHESKAQAVAKYVQSYLPIDRYSHGRPNLEYPISSLYFDSVNLHLCQETMDKKVNRFKLRVRCYDDEVTTPCFFEIKRRANNVILKDRARVSKDDVARIIRNNYVPESLYKEYKTTLRQFQLYTDSLSAHPFVLIRYMRQAFEGRSANRVRITFDRKLAFNVVNAPVIRVGGSGWNRIPMDFVVLEIKFTERYPAWLSEMVKMFDLKQTAMSKYVSSARHSCALGMGCQASKVGAL